MKSRNFASTLATALLSVAATSALAASHSDAPMMVLDPSANITDVYAFVGQSPNGMVLNILMNTNPLEDPGNGVIYDRFADDVLYSLHIAKARQLNGEWKFRGNPAYTFNFEFSNSYKNNNTILSYGLGTEAGPIQMTNDARQNFVQRYKVTMKTGNTTRVLSTGGGLLVPPVNVGFRTTPGYYDAQGTRLQGATTFGQLPVYVQENVHTLSNGMRVFAGQREDGFYADTAGIFDFLGVRSPGHDSFSGYNVHTIAMQIPLDKIIGPNEYPIVGVYATTSRRSITVRRNDDDESAGFGPWVQVSRMGNPLFNETLVALKDKDKYNMMSPTTDDAKFKTYAEHCELAFLLNAVFGTQFVVDGRTDLANIFIPDLLKVDLSTPAVPLAGQAGFNRLSFIGGDTVLSAYTNAQTPSGWPNGRRLGDDVVDIALTAIASGPSYQSITPLGDNVSSNDTAYDLVFPYAGTPWGGPNSTLHP